MSTWNAASAPPQASSEAHIQEAPVEMGDPPRETPLADGRVKWFNDQKGFGFISDADGRDVFVHYAVIEGDGFKTLKDGEIVRYNVAEGPKGLRATRVVRQHH